MAMNTHPRTDIVDVVCATCGTAHRVRSTAASLSIEVCSNCHPAFTGVERTVSAGSRVERFNRRLARAA